MIQIKNFKSCYNHEGCLEKFKALSSYSSLFQYFFSLTKKFLIIKMI